jgi:hypothetical protein
MSTVRGALEITLSGPPTNASGLAPFPSSGSSMLPISLKLGDQLTVFNAAIRPFGQATSQIRLRLPPETPPGSYSGAGTIDGKPVGFAVVVEPVVRVRIHPKRTSLSVAAGSRTEFVITVMNAGNVPLDVPKSNPLDLDDAEGQDRSLGRALRATLKQGESRVERFFEEMRLKHGGEAQVTILQGAGGLAAGASADLTCLLEIPAAVQAGASYLGAWQLGNAAHVLALDVTKGSAPAPLPPRTSPTTTPIVPTGTTTTIAPVTVPGIRKGRA